jgi:hypothetical protein
MSNSVQVAEGPGWSAHVAADCGGRPAWKMVWGWRAHVEDGVGGVGAHDGWAHEENLNLNLNTSLNLGKIWNKFGEI